MQNELQGAVHENLWRAELLDDEAGDQGGGGGGDVVGHGEGRETNTSASSLNTYVSHDATVLDAEMRTCFFGYGLVAEFLVCTSRRGSEAV